MTAFFLQSLQGTAASLFDTLAYLPAALGFYISLRCLRFPDLTVEGSFVLGQALSAVFLVEHYPAGIALLLAAICGALCGLMTAFQHVVFRIPAFVCGIVTTFAVTSVNYRLLGFAGRGANTRIVDSAAYVGETSSVNLGHSGVFEAQYHADFQRRSLWGELRLEQLTMLVLVVMAVVFFTWILLRTLVGLRLRAFGAHRTAASIYVRRSSWAVFAGLALANTLVCFSGALAAQAYRLAALETGAALLIPLLAAVVLGEFIVDFLWPKLRRRVSGTRAVRPLLSRPGSLAMAPVLGFMAYNAVFLGISIIVMPGIGSGRGGVSSNNKYWITAALILVVLILRGPDLGARPPEDVI